MYPELFLHAESGSARAEAWVPGGQVDLGPAWLMVSEHSETLMNLGTSRGEAQGPKTS